MHFVRLFGSSPITFVSSLMTMRCLHIVASFGLYTAISLICRFVFRCFLNLLRGDSFSLIFVGLHFGHYSDHVLAPFVHVFGVFAVFPLYQICYMVS